MQPISYARHRFPPEIIRHAVWLCRRFRLSYRDVEERLAVRGLEASYESNWHRIRDAMFERLRAHFSEAQIVELTWRIALCGAFNCFNDVLQVEVPEGG